MNKDEESLVNLILKENISAIVTMAERLRIPSEEVKTKIQELIDRGELSGNLTEDGQRFFKSTITVSSAPTISHEEKQPEFLTYNTMPGKIIAVVGFFVLAGGIIVNAIAVEIQEQNIAIILILIGLMVFLIGLYLIARRGGPD